jgi:hypothetical protein
MMIDSAERATGTGLLLLCMMVLAVCAGPAPAQTAAGSTVIDPQSGVAFPVTLAPPGSAGPHQLTGTATRERTIFKVNVYAFGLYVDAEVARKELASFKGKPPEALDHTFYQRLLEMRIPMTMRLVMTRDISGEAIAKAFDDALKPRVANAAKDLNRTEGAAALERFRGYFNLRELARGTEFVFSCRPGGRLSTTVNTLSKPEIQSAALCWALFDVYLGDKPISSEGRRSLISGFPELIGHSK